ncbi:class I SAM-dependent methyltransferase [Pseudomonas nicosulfuronedens]
MALDQDPVSLGEVEHRYGDGLFNLKTQCAPVRELIKGDVKISNFDLIYAAGLFDYLPTEAASRLVDVLFAALNPGGKLVFANFMPGLPDAGYMEAIMNWWLIYRTPQGINQLADGIAADRISIRYQYADPVGVAGYRSLVRAA